MKRRMGLASLKGPLSPLLVKEWQFKRLQQLVGYVNIASPFYKNRLPQTGATHLDSWDAFQQIPFTTAEDIKADPLRFSCVSQGQIARVTTLRSSGTTARPKQLFFTENDLELTRDFFRWGMATLVSPGDTVLILLPGAVPASVGDLLVEALSWMHVKGIVYGPVTNPGETLASIRETRANTLVGIPVQVLSLARHPDAARIVDGTVKSVLLSTDYAPNPLVSEIENTFGCRVYDHYGTTEMGLGGAVQCDAHDGYHLREADLLFEIIDPGTGKPADSGETGELVVTTLTRTGMPLLRYRTGDLACQTTAPCQCGSLLNRLKFIRGRMESGVLLKCGKQLHMNDLDDRLFSIKGLLDFSAALGKEKGKDCLKIDIKTVPGAEKAVQKQIRPALEIIEWVKAAVDNQTLSIRSGTLLNDASPRAQTVKRIITILPDAGM